jgi:CRISPR-associated protein Csb2
LRIQGTGRDTRVLFSQPSKPRFKPVEYGTRVSRRVFELRDRTDESRLWPWPLDRVAPLIDTLRGRTANRLEQSFPELAAQIARSLRGSSEAATNQIQILPLPSIGHVHVDRAIRRLAVDVPGESGLPPEDVFWAFTNVEMSPDQPFVLVESSDQTMLARFVPDQPTRRWRSITPVVVAEQAKRRRIEPSRRKLDAKGAIERRSEETRAVDAVRTALNQIGVRATLVDINLQREPFDARGARAERFAKQAAFAKERMWHVEMELSEPIEGPLVIGDGRFVGLGLMVPVVDVAGVFAFATTMRGEERVVHDQLVRAMRRALMSRVQAHIGSKPLDRFFSGHERDGQPARSETSNHVAIQWDPTTARLLVLAPHVLDHRLPTRDEREHIELLSRALDGFTVLRAGRAGVLTLSLCTSRETDEYRERGRSWMSVRPYTITRHPRGMTASDALIRDVVAECERRNLPRPKVTVLAHRGAPHLGLQGKLRIDFDVVVKGPIALGRTRYLGGGLFRAIQG